MTPETMTPGTTPPLSSAGAVRREAILRDATAAMSRLHRRRRAGRRAAALALVIAPVAVITALAARPAPTGPGVTEAIAARPAVELITVRSDAGILARYAPAETFTARILDDQMLVETLREIDRPAGVIRMGGRVMVSATVVDPQPSG
jgi:hypothetical protein